MFLLAIAIAGLYGIIEQIWLEIDAYFNPAPPFTEPMQKLLRRHNQSQDSFNKR